FEGNKYSHACPFARIMEEGLASRLMQVGIRTMNDHQYAQAKKFGVEVIEMKDWKSDLQYEFDGPVYISLDMDAIDPAFAPGVSHFEPGGFTTREIISILQRVKGNVVGADLVEYNVTRDPTGVTGMLAGKLFKELLDVMAGKQFM
ncbi:MAG: arginase family protein, partial [Cyclobacteriaceae bacterium]